MAGRSAPVPFTFLGAPVSSIDLSGTVGTGLAFPSIAFTTPAIAAQAVQSFSAIVGLNRFLILKLTIMPSEPESSNRFEIYQSSTFAADLLAYGTSDFEGDLIEPMEERGLGPTERTFGLPAIYADRDAVGRMYLRIANNHTLAQTYDIHLSYWPIQKVVAGTGITVTGDPDSGDERITLSQTADSVRQLVTVQVDGSTIGTVPVLNLKSGNRFGVTGALSGTTADLTFTAADQVAALEALIWSTNHYGD